MATFREKFILPHNDILIPILQRDYVQGGRYDKIAPFIEELYSSCVSGNEIHLNYIYGYDEEFDGHKGYIAIDGQQRLTTLWLLYLYAYSTQGIRLDTKLIFISRPYSKSFIKGLEEHIAEYVNDRKIESSIKNSKWFISSWLDDASVRNIISTLSILSRYNFDIEHFDLSRLDFITFDFLDMHEEGKTLTDDVYVKMNGRGKPLTYFENLKSWIDERLPKANTWQNKIDNDWAELFWRNRNVTQEVPEDIDDEQTRLFYSLMYIYWLQHKTELENCYEKEESFENLPQEYCRSRILETLFSASNYIPTYWLDKSKLNLLNSSVIEWIELCLDKLLNLESLINNVKVNLGFGNNTTILYSIALGETTYARTLPLLYACIKCPNTASNRDEFEHWIRLVRNLVYNSSIYAENISDAFESIDCLSQLVDHSDVLLAASKLGKGEDRLTLRVFDEGQQKHEAQKACLFLDVIKNHPDDKAKIIDPILDLENYGIFHGYISGIFSFLGEEYSNNLKDNLIAYCNTIKILFNEDIHSRFPEYIFRRALVCYEPHKIGRKQRWRWNNVINGEDWKIFISDTTDYGVPMNNSLYQIIKRCVGLNEESVEKELQRIIDENAKYSSEESSWTLFAKYPEVWQYMESKYSYAENQGNDNNILLIKRVNMGEKNARAELRAYTLYLDCTQLYSEDTLNGWSINYYEFLDDYSEVKNSCMYLEKSIGNEKVAVDVYYNIKDKFGYYFQLMTRPRTNEDKSDEVNMTEKFIPELIKNDVELNHFALDPLCGARFENTNPYRRSEALKLIQHIISTY